MLAYLAHNDGLAGWSVLPNRYLFSRAAVDRGRSKCHEFLSLYFQQAFFHSGDALLASPVSVQNSARNAR